MKRINALDFRFKAPNVRGFFVPSFLPHEGFRMTFANLTYEQQIAQLKSAAESILHHYGLTGAQVELLSYANNAVFKVTVSPDVHYVLRVHRPGHKKVEWIFSELVWLTTLNEHSHVQVPHPIPTQNGAWLVGADVETLDAQLPCVLFQWIEGQFYTAADISIDNVYQAATFVAGLHEFSSTFKAPQGFTRPRLDSEGLFGEQSPYNPGEGARIFTADQKLVFAAVEDRVRTVFNELDALPHSFGVIHADFLPKNFLFTPTGVAAIDFDDVSWGYYLYDLAPTLLLFKAESRYAELREAWLSGYASVRALPPRHADYLEAFMAARHLASCRWQAGHLHNPRIREHAAEVIAHRTEDLRRFLDTGSL
ncbi:MAG: phosphotransferase [Anaerolineae bacterium]|nr:phosphotransferase [Anaerolineae bacterium]